MTVKWSPPTALRTVARHTALDLLAAWSSLSGTTSSAEGRPRVHLLYLHETPKAELPRLRVFVEGLRREHDIVSYSEAVSAIQSGIRLTRPMVALSFDDGFASNAAAGRLLAELGVSACFFVPVGFVGCGSVAAARDYFGMRVGVNEPAMTWTDLERLKADGHEVGNHTISHRVIADIPGEQADNEIRKARDLLEARLGSCEHFAWPRGLFRHITERAVRTVFAVGHVSCASAVRGSHLADGSPRPRACLRRDHLVAQWPLRHLRYFVAAGSHGATTGDWPAGWRV